MNKQELVSRVAKKYNTDDVKVDYILNGILDVMEEALINREKIKLVGHGTYEVRNRQARNRHDFSSGKVVKRESYDTITYTPSKKLKDKLNN